MDVETALRAGLELARRTRTRVDGLVVRAVIASVNDALKTQRLKITLLADQPIPNVEHLQPYGLSFTPPAGAEGLALAIGGDPSHRVVVCAQHPDQRPKGNDDPGTGGLYAMGQWRVFLDKDGVTNLGAKAAADFVALAQLVLAELNDIRDKFDTHIHTTTATVVVGSPVGVVGVPTTPMGPAQSVAAASVKAT